MTISSNPRVKYKIPQKLVDSNLSLEEKIRLLKEWAVDEQLKSIAEEENMLRDEGNINQLSEWYSQPPFQVLPSVSHPLTQDGLEQVALE